MSEREDNYHSVQGPLGAKGDCTEDREENDYYATDPVAIQWLMELENLDHNIWECACGEGHLAKPLLARGYNVKCTDLIDRGFGIGGIDLFQQNEIFDGDIITNPPFKCAQKFIEKALELVQPGKKVCMFLKLQFLEGKTRKEFFEKNPPKRIYVSCSRIACGRNGVFKPSMIAYAWYVWEKGYTGDTILRWFN